MHRKLKNVLSGLAMACVALVGGAMFGEPAHVHAADAGASGDIVIELDADALGADLPSLHIELSDADVQVHIHLVSPASATDVRSPRHRAAFQMPYFSFGATLPRAPSSVES